MARPNTLLLEDPSIYVLFPDHDDPLEQLSALVRSERGAFVAVARSEGLSSEEALDCVQDALCTFLARAGADSGPKPSHEHAVASVKTIVRNAARNTRRKHVRLKRHEPVHDMHDLAADAALVEELLSHAEDVVRLRLCVAKLCDVQRAVVMLRLLEERSGEDVAATLGLKRAHIDVLVHRARASLHVCVHRRD